MTDMEINMVEEDTQKDRYLIFKLMTIAMELKSNM